jgi:hypothetical protein
MAEEVVAEQTRTQGDAGRVPRLRKVAANAIAAVNDSHKPGEAGLPVC